MPKKIKKRGNKLTKRNDQAHPKTSSCLISLDIENGGQGGSWPDITVPQAMRGPKEIIAIADSAT